MIDRVIYNPMVARRCPRCRQYNSQFTEGGRVQHEHGETAGESTRAARFIICTNCGHKWAGRLTRTERGLE